MLDRVIKGGSWTSDDTGVQNWEGTLPHTPTITTVTTSLWSPLCPPVNHPSLRWVTHTLFRKEPDSEIPSRVSEDRYGPFNRYRDVVNPSPAEEDVYPTRSPETRTSNPTRTESEG